MRVLPRLRALVLSLSLSLSFSCSHSLSLFSLSLLQFNAQPSRLSTHNVHSIRAQQNKGRFFLAFVLNARTLACVAAVYTPRPV